MRSGTVMTDAPALLWLPGVRWSGIQDDYFGEQWVLEQVDGRALADSLRWSPREWVLVDPHVGEHWTWEMMWENSTSCLSRDPGLCKSFVVGRVEGHSLVRLDVLEALPDSARWKGGRDTPWSRQRRLWRSNGATRRPSS